MRYIHQNKDQDALPFHLANVGGVRQLFKMDQDILVHSCVATDRRTALRRLHSPLSHAQGQESEVIQQSSLLINRKFLSWIPETETPIAILVLPRPNSPSRYT